MLADAVDGVIGVDTHRDVHHAEIAHPSGAVIAACSVPNTSSGYAQLLDWVREHAPGPRLAACIEGTRSYGAGLARAAAAAGLVVIECEQPTRKTRRGKGKSDPADAHLAVLTALRLDVECTAASRGYPGSDHRPGHLIQARTRTARADHIPGPPAPVNDGHPIGRIP
jgi:hypothetical protein